MTFDIRSEVPSDHAAIFRLTKAAFEPMPFSDGDEAECIDKLRADGDLTLSFVATDGGEIIGHIAFSPVFLNNSFDHWYGLGPVSVAPERQRSGIGSALINHGLSGLKRLDAMGCVLIGDPNYYRRFGFVGDGRLTYRELAPEIVQWLAFGEEKPEGTLRYSPGLE